MLDVFEQSKSKPKKRVSKRKKSAWRNIDNSDVEIFLDTKRLEERLGGPPEARKDKDLFVLDFARPEDQVLTRKQKAILPPKCFANLTPSSAVPDPVVKRNRVRTKEERKHPIRKAIDERNKRLGIVQRKVLLSNADRARTLQQKKDKKKISLFENDIWAPEKKVDPATEWLSEDTFQKNFKGTDLVKVRQPKGILKKKSALPPIEDPHPGTSYNPTYVEHKKLIDEVAEEEMKRLKQEAHIKRVTENIFKKVATSRNEWFEEMSAGLVKPEVKKEAEEEEEKDNEYHAINPPSNPLKKKTKKQRRIQKELRKEAQLRKQLKVEKKKRADLYKLRFINEEIETVESKKNAKRELKKCLRENTEKTRVKCLGPNKFVDPGHVFSRSHEIKGNLRGVNPQGSILKDRFVSFQKRNILQPTVKQLKLRKKKVKRITKRSHKDDQEVSASSLAKRRNQVK